MAVISLLGIEIKRQYIKRQYNLWKTTESSGTNVFTFIHMFSPWKMRHNSVLDPSKLSLIRHYWNCIPQHPSKPFILNWCCGGHRRSTAPSHIRLRVPPEQSADQFSIFLQHIPESWPHLWKSPPVSDQHSAVESERKSEATTSNKKGHVLDLSELYHGRVCLLGCRDVYRRSWKLTLCVATADGWAEMVFGQILLPQYLHTGRQAERQSDIQKGQTDRQTDRQTLDLALFYFNTLQTVVAPASRCLLLLYHYLPLKVKHSPIVLWELISCWCGCCYCCCCCCREYWYSACAAVLILLHQSSAWIIMAGDCKAMPRASLHIIMRWRYDWCQMNPSYLEKNKTTTVFPERQWHRLMDVGWLGKLLGTERSVKLSALDI